MRPLNRNDTCRPRLPASPVTNREGGYTLIQVAIGLVVLGVLTAPLMGAYNLYRKNQIVAQSYERIETLTAALQNFRDTMGAYPCPAPLKRPRTPPPVGYGAATSCRTDAAITGLTPGNCDTTLGICVEQAIGPRIAALTPAQSRVIVGAVPFRDLQLEEEQALDPYGSRIVYAVTESMTDRDIIDDTKGAISVRKADGTPLLTPDGSAAFFLFSPGPTKGGAYAMEGGLVQPCNPAATADGANCNAGFETGSFTPPDSVYVSDVQRLATGAGFFDDMTGYFSDRFNPLWQRTLSNPEVVEDLSPGAVGIGSVTNIPSSVSLQIDPGLTDSATLRIQNTKDPAGAPLLSGLRTPQVCSADGSNCFVPSVLAGDPSSATGGMLCATGFMVGIEDKAPICRNNLSFHCPPGKILLEVTASGAPICGARPVANCPPTTRTECGVTISLPTGANGTLSSWSPSLDITQGGCRRVRYSCSAGAWGATPSANNGKTCSFTPVTMTSAPLPCPTGYTGTYTTTSTSTCLGGSVAGSTFATTCTCVGGSFPETRACSHPSVLNNPNMSGNATRTKTYNTPSCAVTYSPWDTSACTCSPPPILTQVVSGPACTPPLSGVTGFIQQTFNTAPAVCAWQTTASLPGTCTCSLGDETDLRPHTCADPICEKSVVPDVFSRPRDPATCLGTGSWIPQSTGACAPNSFAWTYQEQAEASASIQVRVGDACSCAQKVANTTKICDTGTGKAVCGCQ